MYVLIWGVLVFCVVSFYWWCSFLYDTYDILYKMLIILGLDFEVELFESRLKKSIYIGYYLKI